MSIGKSEETTRYGGVQKEKQEKGDTKLFALKYLLRFRLVFLLHLLQILPCFPFFLRIAKKK